MYITKIYEIILNQLHICFIAWKNVQELLSKSVLMYLWTLSAAYIFCCIIRHSDLNIWKYFPQRFLIICRFSKKANDVAIWHFVSVNMMHNLQSSSRWFKTPWHSCEIIAMFQCYCPKKVRYRSRYGCLLCNPTSSLTEVLHSKLVFCVRYRIIWYRDISIVHSIASTAIDHIINTLRPRQNFTDDKFKCNFLSEKVRISIIISLRCVPEGPIKTNQHWFR